MKFLKIAVTLLLGVSFAQAQTEKIVESKITDVTVFLARAQVSRSVETRIEAGKTSLVVKGLTSDLDPQSIQVSGKGNFIILGTSHRQNYLNELNMPKSLKILRDSVEYYTRQVGLEASQKEILNKEEQMLLSNQKIGGTNQNLTVAELKAMADFYRTRLTDIVNTRVKQDEKIKRLNGRISLILAQINSQNELYSRNTSEIVINLSSSTVTPVELEVNYVVVNAGWFPVYDIRATNTRSPISLSYKANVIQSTGEEWKNVHLKLSTANANLSGLKPELVSWFLDFYQPVANYYNSDRKAGMARPTMMNRDVSKSKEEGETLKVAETAAEYVSAIQTTLNTEFDISIPYTVSSANRPTLVEIRDFEMKAQYQYAVAPKLDLDAYLMAKATGWEEFNLLPGEANIFFEGTYVGKTMIDPNSVKDTISISLGRDKRIVVKRERLKDFTTRKALAGNIRETHAWEISVRNTKQEAIKIVVEDQVPLTRNNQIEVLVTDTGLSNYNKDTGKLVWIWNLNTGETKKAVFKFEVKYPKDKPISGL